MRPESLKLRYLPLLPLLIVDLRQWLLGAFLNRSSGATLARLILAAFLLQHQRTERFNVFNSQHFIYATRYFGPTVLVDKPSLKAILDSVSWKAVTAVEEPFRREDI